MILIGPLCGSVFGSEARSLVACSTPGRGGMDAVFKTDYSAEFKGFQWGPTEKRKISRLCLKVVVFSQVAGGGGRGGRSKMRLNWFVYIWTTSNIKSKMFQFPFFVFFDSASSLLLVVSWLFQKMSFFCLSPPFGNSVFARAVKRPPPIVGEAPGGARAKVEEPTRDRDSSAKTGDQFFWYF